MRRGWVVRGTPGGAILKIEIREVPVDLSDLPVAVALLEGMGEVIDRSDTEVSAIVYGVLGNLTPALITVRRDAGGLVDLVSRRSR